MADQRTSSSSTSRRKRAGDEAVGQFVIGSEIGKGSFAQVYMGRHQVSGAAVAIKSVELARLNKKLKENLYGEIKILKTLRHPHIVALHDCVESATHINLIMEYCELGDLSLFIKKREKLLTNPATHEMARKYPNAPNSGLNEVVIRHFLKQLASALQFLRAGNFVHRDVKPQNLLLLPSPEYRETHHTSRPILTASNDSLIPAAGLLSLPMLKLADFGFARVLPSTSLAETLCGSPLYMAPEILRYERYDAKADLWSVGTVLYEMVTGRPPFRATNHVELLRKIEAAEDTIRFPRESIVSSDMKSLIRALLRRNPVERLSFENFFAHVVVTGPIPGVVEDDIPKPERLADRLPERRAASKTDEPVAAPRRHSSFRRWPTDNDSAVAGPSSPREQQPPRPTGQADEPRQQSYTGEVASRRSQSPRLDAGDGLGIRRPQQQQQPSSSAPTRPELRPHRLSNASMKQPLREIPSSPLSSLREPGRGQSSVDEDSIEEQERAAQDVAFERDYVVVEKKHVEVNAFADELAANKVLAAQGGAPLSPKSGQMVRRTTQQGSAASGAGAVATTASRAVQIVPGTSRPYHDRRGSLSASPASTASFISKAIQDASLRLLGVRQPLGKGSSPPQLYSPFPAYPTPTAPIGLIGDGRQGAPVDEDARVAQLIEDYATRSDVVYGFAEVKYKQLVPLAPSMDHGLGGVLVDKMSDEGDDGLTIDAVVTLSEEALVLYVKALQLLAKSMDIAGLWWTRRTRTDASNGGISSTRELSSTQNLVQRINSAVQWIRSRFNEVLEKAEVVRLKLIETQKQLPEDHPSHPSNHTGEPGSTSGSAAEGVVITAGTTAEKLMYDRAVEMSRIAAINELATDDLPGCEISYMTAVRMLEAILDSDDDLPRQRRVSGSRDTRPPVRDPSPSELDNDDQQTIQKMIQMITSRLAVVRKKNQIITSTNKAQRQQQQASLVRRRSGDVTPRSIPSHAS